MSVQARDAFLAEPRVGVLSVEAPGGRPPLSVPIWYDYVPGGELTVLTGPGSRKASLIRAAGRFSMCVQSEAAPYRYVTVEGTVTGIRSVTDAQRRDMALRYLGPEYAERYVAETQDTQSGNVAITMRPDRWHSADFSDLASDLTS